MNILIDMNLSPEWEIEFKKYSISAIHWSKVGKPDADDALLMQWARENDYIVFTHDLDFGTAIALSGADKPSVIQVRTQDVTVSHLGKMVISALTNYKDLLTNGALIIIDDDKQRVRILPLN